MLQQSTAKTFPREEIGGSETVCCVEDKEVKPEFNKQLLHSVFKPVWVILVI